MSHEDCPIQSCLGCSLASHHITLLCYPKQVEYGPHGAVKLNGASVGTTKEELKAQAIKLIREYMTHFYTSPPALLASPHSSSCD